MEALFTAAGIAVKNSPVKFRRQSLSESHPGWKCERCFLVVVVVAAFIYNHNWGKKSVDTVWVFSFNCCHKNSNDRSLPVGYIFVVASPRSWCPLAVSSLPVDRKLNFRAQWPQPNVSSNIFKAAVTASRKGMVSCPGYLQVNSVWRSAWHTLESMHLFIVFIIYYVIIYVCVYVK